MISHDSLCSEHDGQAIEVCAHCKKALCDDCVVIENPVGAFCSEDCSRHELDARSIPHHKYDASHIKVLEGIDHVRKRPAMYIGDTSTGGLHHLVYEVLDNSIDESMEGFCKSVEVKIHPDGSLSVLDDGRGIPVDMHVEMKIPAVEVIMTTLHSGGKFDRNSYKVSGGLHGVGVSVVNALSQWLLVEVHREGKIHRQRYERGKTASALEVVGDTVLRGTFVHFLPDKDIFDSTDFSFDILANRLRQIAFLNKGIRVELRDERHEKSESYHYEGGIKAFVETLNENREPIHPEVMYFERQQERIWVEIALQYNSGFRENLLSFVNNIHTKEGGTHVSGMRSALTRTLNAYARKVSTFKGEKLPAGDDYREGLTGVVSVKVPDPQFEGQTKSKLGNREVQGLVESVVNEVLSTYLEENPKTARVIIGKAITAAQHRDAVRKLRDAQRKGALQSGSLPGKLSDCVGHDIDSSELFLVEGDSAAGTAKSGRNRQFQAILPLRGKILNVEKAHLAKMLSHGEINTIIRALGTNIGEDDFDLSKLRYGKIVIMTDADVDGSHIRTLLLTFFFRHMKELIEMGHVYLAQPPLYKLKRGKSETYLHTEEEMDRIMLDHGLEDGRLSVEGHEPFEGERLKQLLEVLLRLDSCCRSLERRDISCEEFLAKKNQVSGKLPSILATHKGKKYFLQEESEIDELLDLFEQAGSERPAVWVEQDFAIESHEDCLVRSELLVSIKLEEAINDLSGFGFETGHFLRNGRNADFRFFTENREASPPIDSLRDLITVIRQLGRTGISLQRYKGLGEMNAEELWETTMNPEARSLVQVKFGDGVKADRMFSVLMGAVVAPRKYFIEKYALEVQDLDI